jgi:hypothetical protein
MGSCGRLGLPSTILSRPGAKPSCANGGSTQSNDCTRRIKTQTTLPCAETVAVLFRALLASGQITMRKVDGWQTLAKKPADQLIDLAA